MPRDYEQKLIFAVLQGPNEHGSWSQLLDYLRTRQSITLADGKVLTYDDAILEAASRFPAEPAYFQYLANKMHRGDTVDINGQPYNCLQLLAHAFDAAPNNRLVMGSVLRNLSKRMMPDDAVNIGGQDMRRLDVLKLCLSKRVFFYGDYCRIAISLAPDEVIVDGEKVWDRLALLQVSNNYDNTTVENILATAVLQPQLERDIRALTRILQRPTRFAIAGLPVEPPLVDYSTLSVGGEDERVGLIAATCANDLRRFAVYALSRRQRIADEAKPKRRNSGIGKKRKHKF